MWYRTVNLICDGCYRQILPTEYNNVARARHYGLIQGWRKDGHRDFCPSCWKERQLSRMEPGTEGS